MTVVIEAVSSFMSPAIPYNSLGFTQSSVDDVADRQRTGPGTLFLELKRKAFVNNGQVVLLSRFCCILLTVLSPSFRLSGNAPCMDQQTDI